MFRWNKNCWSTHKQIQLCWPCFYLWHEGAVFLKKGRKCDLGSSQSRLGETDVQRGAEVGRGVGKGRGVGFQWCWPWSWRRWIRVRRRKSRTWTGKELKRKREVWEGRMWRRELPPGHCLGRGQLRAYQDLHSFIMTSHRWTEVKVFRKESEKGSTSALSIPYWSCLFNIRSKRCLQAVPSCAQVLHKYMQVPCVAKWSPNWPKWCQSGVHVVS